MQHNTTDATPMELTELTEHDPPEAFRGQSDAKLSPFFKSLGKELGGPSETVAISIKDAIKRKWGRTRMKQMFGLTTLQIDTLFAELGAAHWRGTIEESLGMQFAAPLPATSGQLLLTPREAVLMNAAGQPDIDSCGVRIKPEGEGNQEKVLNNTLSEELGAVALKLVMVPEVVYAAIDVGDRAHVVLKTGQMTELTNAWGVWTFANWGKLNVGAAFARVCAKQFAAQFKMYSPSEFEMKLKQKSYTLNRKNAHVGAPNRTSTSHAPTSYTRHTLCINATWPYFMCAQEYFRLPLEVQAIDLCPRALLTLEESPATLGQLFYVLNETDKAKYPSPFAYGSVQDAAKVPPCLTFTPAHPNSTPPQPTPIPTHPIPSPPYPDPFLTHPIPNPSESAREREREQVRACVRA